MAIKIEVQPEINSAFAECEQDFSVPCKPAICPTAAKDCSFKTAILEARRNANCGSCWPIDGNIPSYMQGGKPYFPDLNGSRCVTVGKEQCPVFAIIAARRIAIEATHPESQSQSNHGNGLRNSCI